MAGELEVIDQMGCAHLAHDALGCICRSPGGPEDTCRLVVDHISLQPWCLDRATWSDGGVGQEADLGHRSGGDADAETDQAVVLLFPAAGRA
jgi:hypothetical protein